MAVLRGAVLLQRIGWVIVLACLLSPLHAQERADVTVTHVLSATATASGQPIRLPQQDAQVVVSTYEIMPGATLAAHRHPYPRYAYVLAGKLRVTNLETGQSDTYNPGDFILEAVGQWHVGVNVGSDPIKLLVVDIVEKGQASNTLLQQ